MLGSAECSEWTKGMVEMTYWCQGRVGLGEQLSRDLNEVMGCSDTGGARENGTCKGPEVEGAWGFE